MKKNYNSIIVRTWVVSMISYFIGCAIWFGASYWMAKSFGLYWGFMLLAPLMGFIIASPIILRQENIRKHFERKLEKEKAHN